MIRAGVVGATGYAGAELVRLLAGHPGVELTVLTSRQFAGARFDAVYPALAGVVDNTCEPLDQERLAEACDVVFTALPHKIPMAIVPNLIENHKKVVDLSADFRLADIESYAEWYGHPHRAPELQKEAVYGLTELARDAIRASDLVANPGCYPTSAILALAPLVAEGLIISPLTVKKAYDELERDGLIETDTAQSEAA